MSTVGQPGPGPSGAPWLVTSPTRAAGCPIGSVSVDVHERPAQGECCAAPDIERARSFKHHGSGLDVEPPARLYGNRPALAVDLETIALAVFDPDSAVVEHRSSAVDVRELNCAFCSIIEQQLVSLARFHEPPVVLAVVIGNGGFLLYIP